MNKAVHNGLKFSMQKISRLPSKVIRNCSRNIKQDSIKHFYVYCISFCLISNEAKLKNNETLWKAIYIGEYYVRCTAVLMGAPVGKE
jgi:hypothetical protein